MTNNVYDFSTTAASNVSSLTGINWNEGQLAPTLNNSARSTLAYIAAFIDVTFGALDSGGSANAYTFTSPTGYAFTAYARGQAVSFKANFTNSGAATINVDGLGAKAIQKAGSALASGDIVSGGMYRVIYDGTQFQLENVIPGGQPLDATLTAFAALTITADTYIRGTGTDAFAVDSLGTVLDKLLTVSSTKNPQFATIELGAASDTTITRDAAGSIAIEGSKVQKASDIATQANVEAATAGKLIDADILRYGIGVSKVWANIDMAGTPSYYASYNSSSITDTATGNQTNNLTTAFSSTGFAVSASAASTAANGNNTANYGTGGAAGVNKTASTIPYWNAVASSGSASDSRDFSVQAMGDR
jgi:hypothetical protein